jgi:hypothetical protein
MSAVVVCRMRWLSAIARPWPLLFATIACLCGTSAWAQEEATPATTPATVTTQVLIPEFSTTSLPRFEPDGGTRTSRVDMTWLPAQRSALGLSLGMTTIDGLGLAVPANLGNTGQSMDVGLIWRYTPDGNYRIDVTAWRRVAPQDAASLIQLRDSSYGARVEMRIGRAPIESGFVAQRGFVGFQLESGARITVRRSGGKPMLYYRSNF